MFNFQLSFNFVGPQKKNRLFLLSPSKQAKTPLMQKQHKGTKLFSYFFKPAPENSAWGEKKKPTVENPFKHFDLNLSFLLLFLNTGNKIIT